MDGGVNFSVYSRHAESVSLLLFDDETDVEPTRVVELKKSANKTFDYWHCFVDDVGPGQVYGWRMDGPHKPRAGHRFDPSNVLLDPYARAISSRKADPNDPGDRQAARRSHRSIVVDMSEYDWEDDSSPERSFSQSVIYEMHVGGFTRHPNSGLPEELRGTYAGLCEKIPYLVDLGVTAVELMPVFAFDRYDARDGLVNYWGYSPLGFFAPHADYCSQGGAQAAVDEFRDMVKALHSAGIEVILDVVYNHTAEGNEYGPTTSFRGIDNKTYYTLDRNGRYANYSGCGNTLNANASVVRRIIMDSLHYWVREMHVDGFRFDLASILSRDQHGEPMANPPLLWDIDTDPVLSGTKILAEAWDAAGLYQVGSFFGERWKEWNGKFRDDVRAFFRGDEGTVEDVACRILGSPDIYGAGAHEPERSVNFVTAHDGFTLNDLVSYNRKHNRENLEGNRDGHDHTLSWNCGVEGPTDDPEIESLRTRQIKNFYTITLISLGVPMILMGDEVRRSQRGNNNAYCQDNETSWFDWSAVEEHEDLRRFVRRLIRIRQSLIMFQDNRGVTLYDLLETAEIRWHGVELNEPDWRHFSHSIALEVRGPSGIFFIILNAYEESLPFALPAGAPWRRLIDTSLPSPRDIRDFQEAEIVDEKYYEASPHSVVALSAGINPVEPPEVDAAD